MSLWTSQEIAEATKGQARTDFEVSGISIDSREIDKGDLFVALKSARDGHEFVKLAIQSGAAGALVSKIPEGCENLPLILVDDVEKSLALMGQHRRNEVKARIVAVTGSAGKTSTKEMLREVFEAFGKTHASVKSFNNHWGVPLTLARMPRDTEFGVFEIGMNAPGEIEPLVKQVRPDVAIITNIAAVHLAGFDNELGIAHEKASIMRGLSNSGLAIVLGDMIYRELVQHEAKQQIYFFGRGQDNEIRLTREESFASSTRGVMIFDGQEIEFTIPVAGNHHLQNALAVFATARRFGCDLETVVEVLSKWQAPSGRGQRFEVNGYIVVDESYNANPLSMRAALEAFAYTKALRKIAVLGAMRELGADSFRLHGELIHINALKELDVVHCVGKDMLALYQQLTSNKGHFFENVEELIAQKNELFQKGDAVLFKASNGIGLWRVVDELKKNGQ